METCESRSAEEEGAGAGGGAAEEEEGSLLLVVVVTEPTSRAGPAGEGAAPWGPGGPRGAKKRQNKRTGHGLRRGLASCGRKARPER